jgi:hypothetical protein
LSLTTQTSLGGNGIGLDELLPGLLEMLGRQTPDTATDIDAWNRFAAHLTDAVDGLIRQTTRPDPSLPDATAFYDSVIKVSAPGDALATDARALGSLTTGFSAGVGSAAPVYYRHSRLSLGRPPPRSPSGLAYRAIQFRRALPAGTTPMF